MGLDFKVMSFGRVGTIPLNNFLTIHPQIAIPHVNDVIKAVENSKERRLSLKFANDPQVTRRGIMFHQQEWLLRPELLEMMTKFPAKKLIHVVRNPVDCLISWVNHVNTSALADSLDWEYSGTNIDAFVQKYPAILESLKYGMQARQFYEGMEDVKVVDFDDLLAANVSQSMCDIYDFIGVDPAITSDEFFKKQNNLTVQLLGRGVTIRVNNEDILFRLIPSTLVSINKNRQSLAVFGTYTQMDAIFSLCPSLSPVKGSVDIVIADSEQYNGLQDQTRQIIQQSAGAIARQLMESWAQWAESTCQKIRQVKISKLDEQEQASVLSLLKEDIELFASYHPQYREKWGR